MKWFGYLTTTVAMILFSLAAILLGLAYVLSNGWGKDCIAGAMKWPFAPKATLPKQPKRHDLVPMRKK